MFILFVFLFLYQFLYQVQYFSIAQRVEVLTRGFIISVGIQANGRRINNIRYADDTVLLASSEAGLQMLVNIVQISSEKFGLKLNINKTKVMAMSKQSPNEPSISITVNNIRIGQVQHINYLGSWITTDGRCGKEIRRRINLSKRSFNSMKNIFRDRQLSIQLKTRLLKCFVWPVLMKPGQ